jgi:hypothetical protein
MLKGEGVSLARQEIFMNRGKDGTLDDQNEKKT